MKNKDYESNNSIKKGQYDKLSARPEVKSEADGRIITDPLGSWTGVAHDDIYDTPVQDVDDL